jgi:hypothetical protein
VAGDENRSDGVIGANAQEGDWRSQRHEQKRAGEEDRCLLATWITFQSSSSHPTSRQHPRRAAEDVREALLLVGAESGHAFVIDGPAQRGAAWILHDAIGDGKGTRAVVRQSGSLYLYVVAQAGQDFVATNFPKALSARRR